MIAHPAPADRLDTPHPTLFLPVTPDLPEMDNPSCYTLLNPTFRSSIWMACSPNTVMPWLAWW
ncbi:hypothetical protein [Acetobacter tropicalis]|uniref:hypothetical protein n=1 Tax=Acetobacter tropicalis TaxID=104102 RepID=UPI000AA6EA87|nr:hypothetical protein [Acetobacter tropicalis]